MLSLYSTWEGLLKYDNPQMPKASLTVTFKEGADKKFTGFLSEKPLIIPPDFLSAIDIASSLLTPWGSVMGEIIDGEIGEKVHQKWGRIINFVKLPEQLSGYPVYCLAGFNEAEGLIVGRWTVKEGDTPCALPQNLKQGDFTLRKSNGRRSSSPAMTAPVKPELIPA